jgi:hypothetical protein
LFNFPPYSLHLTNSDLPQYIEAKTFLALHRFADGQELNFSDGTLEAAFCDEGIEQLVPSTINTSIPIATV